MGDLQRYVSDELTHFVGRGRPEEEQYRLLVDVLRSGFLSPEGAHVEGHLLVDAERPLSSNESYEPEAVCLCDIPVGDLAIHIRKYSPFGLSFPKTYLAERGATPIFYIAGDARLDAPDGSKTRADRFDRMAREHHALRDEAASLAEHADERVRAFARRVEAYAHFLDFEVYSYAKFFSYPTREDAAENFYMEREWRLLGSLRFSLRDVRRVILPEAYAERLRQDVPEYHGQVIFGSR